MVLQKKGLRSRNHWIWVMSAPEFQMTSPSPLATKYGVSSAVAPVMAKLAPCAKLAFLALEGGRNGRPSSCAAWEKRPTKIQNGDTRQQRNPAIRETYQ